MGINSKQIQVISQLANLLYDFLPASPHPYADKNISFPGCANKVGLGGLWKGGSKRTAVSQLLRDTLDRSSGRFCILMIEIVNTSILYRANKGNPIKREEIEGLNRLVYEIGYKIPEHWDRSFLNSLPSDKIKSQVLTNEMNIEIVQALKKEYMELAALEPHKRGYAFQDFLNKMFEAYGLRPKVAFRIIGEEMDGSFEMDGNTYLLEAKWQAERTSQKDLAFFSVKVQGKSTWSRGLFVSYIGFTNEGLEAFARGKPTNIVGMNGQDIFFILEGRIDLKNAIRNKVRRAAETNEFFVSAWELS